MSKITKQQAEEILTKKFAMKYVQFSYPGYKPVVGRCDRICIGDTGTKDANNVIIIMNDTKYTCSPESLKECLTILKKTDGDTYSGGTDPSEGLPQNN